MRASFEYTIEREDISADVTVTYYAYNDGDIDIEAITYEGNDFETTSAEDDAIRQACFDRVEEDRIDHEASYGDYVYEMRREAEYPY